MRDALALLCALVVGVVMFAVSKPFVGPKGGFYAGGAAFAVVLFWIEFFLINKAQLGGA